MWNHLWCPIDPRGYGVDDNDEEEEEEGEKYDPGGPVALLLCVNRVLSYSSLYGGRSQAVVPAGSPSRGGDVAA